MIPRVTEILRPFTSFHNVPRAILDKAAARGTSVHALCAAIAKGAWVPENMMEESLRGYVRSFQLWKEDTVKSFEVVETRYTMEGEYSGQVDFVIKNKNGEAWLVDLKTSARPQKTYKVQMAAYMSLLHKHEMYLYGAILVYLDKDGEYPEIDTLNDLEEEHYVFDAALKCYKYFHAPANRKGSDGLDLKPNE